MVEGIQKIKIEELTTIRIHLPTGIVHEMPLSQLASYGSATIDSGTMDELKKLGLALQSLSSKNSPVGVEFVIPVKP